MKRVLQRGFGRHPVLGLLLTLFNVFGVGYLVRFWQQQNFPASPAVSTQTQLTCASSLNLPFGGSFATDVFVQLNCNVTSSQPTGSFVAGYELVLTLQQDSTGGRTFAWPPVFLNPPPVASAANAATVATFQYCGTAGLGPSCPANDWQNTDVGPTGIASQPAFTVSPACNGAINCFTIIGDTQQIWDATVVNGQNTISCPNSDCNFVAATDNGKNCVVTNAPIVGFTGQVGSLAILPEGTLTVTGAQTATCSGGNATANLTAVGALFWGHPDTTLGNGSGTDLVAAAWNATVAACGTLHAGGLNKQGTGPLILWIEQPEINTGTATTLPGGNATCGAGPEGNRRGVAFSGTDINSTYLFIAPNMNFTNCPTNGCWLTVADGGNFHDFTMWGGGVSNIGSGKTFVCLNCNHGGSTSGNNTMNNVRFMGLGAGTSSATLGLSVQGGNQHLDHVEVDGWGGLGCTFNTIGAHLSHLYCGDNNFGNVNITGGTVVIEDSTFGPTLAATTNILTVQGSLSSYGNQINDFSSGGTSSGAVYVHGGTYNAFGDTITSSRGQAIFQDSSGVTRLSGVKGSATGVGAFGINNSSGVVLDLGGNTFTGTSGAYTGAGSYIGEANSANQTIVTAAKLVLSAGWGTTAAWTSLSGGNAPVQGTITNSGTGQGASPTITYTFPTPYQVAPFSCTATQIGGTNATGTFTSSALSATGVTFTFSLTPTASSTEIIQITCVTP